VPTQAFAFNSVVPADRKQDNRKKLTPYRGSLTLSGYYTGVSAEDSFSLAEDFESYVGYRYPGSSNSNNKKIGPGSADAFLFFAQVRYNLP
jgi:hypothetical protein